MRKERYCLLILIVLVCLVVPVTAAGEGKIAFASSRDGNSEIYVVNSDGTGLTRLTNNPAGDSSPAWSMDGTKIAFASDRDGNSEIYVMNADGSGQSRITTNPAGDYSPDWSPDGSKIVFTTNRDGTEHLEIYVINADGSGETQLTTFDSGIYFSQFPTWSPLGSKIAFSGRRDFMSETIYVMNPDGTQQTRIPSRQCMYPAWSPDGSKISMACDEFEMNIFVMDAGGTGLKPLTENGPNSPVSVWNSFPTWSPDGSKIAYGHGSDIYVMNADGTGETLFMVNGGDPDWGPAKGEIPAPEFPSAFLPATMIIGVLGAVLLIQRTRE